MTRLRETSLMLIAAVLLLGCAANGKPVAYGETSITTNADRNAAKLDQLALSVVREVREGKPKATYVLKWELIPNP